MNPKAIGISALLAVFAVPAAYAGAGAPGHTHAHGGKTAFGVPGDPRKPARMVIVTANEGDGKMEFIPGQITVKPGEQIRFKIENHGELDHEFVLGTAQEIAEHAELMKKFPEMEHSDPSSIRLQTKGNGEILWKFTKAGSFVFACLIPDHMEAGMLGKIAVK